MKWLWTVPWTAANFRSVFILQNRSIARSRRRKGWCEFSAHLLTIGVAALAEGRAVGPKPIRDDGLRSTVALHRLLDELQGSGLVPRLGDVGCQHFGLLAQRGIEVSYETVRCWTLKFGRKFAAPWCL